MNKMLTLEAERLKLNVILVLKKTNTCLKIILYLTRTECCTWREKKWDFFFQISGNTGWRFLFRLRGQVWIGETQKQDSPVEKNVFALFSDAFCIDASRTLLAHPVRESRLCSSLFFFFFLSLVENTGEGQWHRGSLVYWKQHHIWRTKVLMFRTQLLTSSGT